MRTGAWRFGARDITLLGVLSAIGPIGVDIYLPAFPEIAADLKTSVGDVQLSMAAYFLALGLGQLPYGALSDRVGRKPPILFGLAVFVAGSLVCGGAPSAAMLVAGRFLQGLGICAILSIVRAIVRDVHRGGEAAHIAARMLLIVSVSPLLAPLAGSAIISVASWRLIFWLMAGLSVGVLMLTWRNLPETGRKQPSGRWHAVPRHALELLRLPAFLWPTLLLAGAQAGASIYLAGSSSIYLVTYGVQPWTYSLAFAVNAVGMIFAAQWNRRLIGRLGLGGVTMLGTGLGTLAIAVFLAAELAGLASFALAMVCFFLFFTSFGFVMGPSSVLALEDQGDRAGIAAGLQGTIQFVTGAGAAALIGLQSQGSLEVMLQILILSQAAALAMAALCTFRLQSGRR